MKSSLAASPSYRNFIRDRDIALEELHKRSQRKITDLLNGALNCITEKVAARLARSVGTGIMMLKHEVSGLEREVDNCLSLAFPAILGVITELQDRAYLLARAGETEAMGRALRSKLRFNIAPRAANYDDIQERIGRTALALDRLRREIVDAYQSARVSDLSVEEALARVENTYPKVKKYRRGPKFLRAVKALEAVRPKSDPYSFGIMDEEEWSNILDDFKNEFIPKFRHPDAVFDVQEHPGTEFEWYGWEVEQQLTDDFVRSVRAGQVDAAQEQGINDFQWIAVLDDRTDDCCAWRDGLTSTQIETRLSSDMKDDDCQVSVPPAHFNCRCTLAPVTEQVPSEDAYNPQSFEEWLTS